eukprot:CAMPEP_0203674764 /NCGR_PEP_ID=MMETSP0090-20130426/17187_1 /ASSEMBLY_ACC=CAM_ASM_001088 /TAXON_ID=426623 /ORGANISM="Chaetoceros affinis, Strain CCMP159" /LENGTH=631 /DNA_ID=CAMNT_0050540723 /DNA_START=52 /DNA_END=1947 /DNA_ORIENTATION=-
MVQLSLTTAFLLVLTLNSGSHAFSSCRIERHCAPIVPSLQVPLVQVPSQQKSPHRQSYNKYGVDQNPNRRVQVVRMSSLQNNNGENKRPKRWRKLATKLNPLKLVLKALYQMNKSQSSLRSKFASLSKKGKLLFGIQIMTLMLIFGAGTNQLVTNIRGNRVTSAKVARSRPVEVPYSVFMDMVEKSGKGHTAGKNPAIEINDINIGKDRIFFQLKSDEVKHNEALTNSKLVQKNDIAVKTIQPRSIYTMKVDASPDLVSFLRDNQIPFRAASKSKSDILTVMARSSILIIYMLFLLRMYKTMAGGGNSGDVPGKLARQRQTKDGEPSIQFKDIEGIDEAKFEVMELVDSLRNPGKYAILGARAPRGLLLEGPPGTGKTMLARACASAAAVPLLYCSGSDFVEMFVGRGAARVRKTFERASKLAPCIIFIDELDALGKSRSSSEMMGMQMRSNDEAEQTLNQLLACMDGLDSKKGICVLAATNRREVLDTALIRPGRFDRLIRVKLPDIKGREKILRVHAKKLPGFKEGVGVDDSRFNSLGKGDVVDLSALAAVTQGLSGAELEFIVNEAAIRAVRRVSAALREGKDPGDIKSPHVNAMDFEDSVKSYFDTRKSNNKGMGDVLSNVLRPKVT